MNPRGLKFPRRICMVTQIGRVRINRVRLPILLVVGLTEKMKRTNFPCRKRANRACLRPLRRDFVKEVSIDRLHNILALYRL